MGVTVGRRVGGCDCGEERVTNFANLYQSCLQVPTF